MGTEKQPVMGGTEKQPVIMGTEKTNTLFIYDKVYDISTFAKKHPGGRVISFYDNQEATEAFEAFHRRSKPAYEALAKLPNKKVAKKCDKPVLLDFRKLKAKWLKQGLFKPKPMMDFIFMAAIILGHLFSFWLLQFNLILSGIMQGIFAAHLGFLQHNAGHRTTFGDNKKNFIFQWFAETILKGGSPTWWRNRHNQHHAKTQVMGMDKDLQTVPLLAWDRIVGKKCVSWLLPFQHLYFIPFLMSYVFIFFGVLNLWIFRKKNIFEFLGIIAHFSMVCPFVSHLAWGPWFLWWSLNTSIHGVYLGFFFSLSHFVLPVIHDDSHTEMDWCQMQVEETLNWSTRSSIYRWLSGHLNCQIEHHLCPEMHCTNYQYILDDVQNLCKKHGLNYREYNFSTAVWLNFETLRKVGIGEVLHFD